MNKPSKHSSGSGVGAGVGGPFWSLTGNGGTDPSSNFIGTTDEQPLVIKTDGAEAIRIDTNGNVGIGTDTPLAKLDITDKSGTFTELMDDPLPANPAISTINVANTTGFPETGTLVVSYSQAGAEVMTYSGKTGTTFTSVERGQLGTAVVELPKESRVSFITLIVTGDVEGTPRMVVTSDGRLGIGTATPDVSLQISDLTSYPVTMLELTPDSGTAGRQATRLAYAKNTRHGYLYVFDAENENLPLELGGQKIVFATHKTQNVTDLEKNIRVVIDVQGKVGIGIEEPVSKLQVKGGYIHLDTSDGMPPAADCSEAAHVGRMKVDSVNKNLYVCTASDGWVIK